MERSKISTISKESKISKRSRCTPKKTSVHPSFTSFTSFTYCTSFTYFIIFCTILLKNSITKQEILFDNETDAGAFLETTENPNLWYILDDENQ